MGTMFSKLIEHNIRPRSSERIINDNTTQRFAMIDLAGS